MSFSWPFIMCLDGNSRRCLKDFQQANYDPPFQLPHYDINPHFKPDAPEEPVSQSIVSEMVRVPTYVKEATK